MSFINALALVLCVIGGLLTYLALGPAANFFLIWAIFIATATGVALGGSTESFKNLVICGIAGVVIAWVASLVILSTVAAVGLPLPVYAAIIVGLTTGSLALIANIPAFPAIPATVVGYAMTFAYLLQTPGKLDLKVLLSATLYNPLICISLSILVAAAFGIVALNLAGKLSTAKTA
jgi:hypothetical protein